MVTIMKYRVNGKENWENFLKANLTAECKMLLVEVKRKIEEIEEEIMLGKSMDLIVESFFPRNQNEDKDADVFLAILVVLSETWEYGHEIVSFNNRKFSCADEYLIAKEGNGIVLFKRDKNCPTRKKIYYHSPEVFSILKIMQAMSY